MLRVTSPAGSRRIAAARWYTFDARNSIPRISRILIAQGRDAADAPITQTFGPNTPVSFKVWTDEIVETAGEEAFDRAD